MCNFKVGEKVVCIYPAQELIKGEIYTVRGSYLSVNKKETGIYLEEIKRPICNFFKKEIGFRQTRFRKLDYQFGHDICAELSRQYNEEFIEL